MVQTVRYLTVGNQPLYFVDIRTVIFSVDPRVVPFPVWRTKKDRREADLKRKQRKPALIIRLEGRPRHLTESGPAPDPGAA